MATHPPTPTRHIYRFTNPGQYKEVRHYKLIKADPVLVLDEMLNVSKDRNFSKAKDVHYWLKGKKSDQKKWSRPITGLKPVGFPFTYYGDIPKWKNKRFEPHHLLIFRFSEPTNELIIDVYTDFYTENKKQLHEIIQRGI